jgi:hypothetical protein
MKSVNPHKTKTPSGFPVWNQRELALHSTGRMGLLKIFITLIFYPGSNRGLSTPQS